MGLGGQWDALRGKPGRSTEPTLPSLTVFSGHQALLLSPSGASSMQQPLPLPIRVFWLLPLVRKQRHLAQISFALAAALSSQLSPRLCEFLEPLMHSASKHATSAAPRAQLWTSGKTVPLPPKNFLQFLFCFSFYAGLVWSVLSLLHSVSMVQAAASPHKSLPPLLLSPLTDPCHPATATWHRSSPDLCFEWSASTQRCSHHSPLTETNDTAAPKPRCISCGTTTRAAPPAPRGAGPWPPPRLTSSRLLAVALQRPMWLAKAEVVGELRSSCACHTKSHTEMRAAMVPRRGGPRKGNCHGSRGRAGAGQGAGATLLQQRGRRQPLSLHTHPLKRHRPPRGAPTDTHPRTQQHACGSVSAP